jgi:uncharacterized protein (DUF1330 family)
MKSIHRIILLLIGVVIIIAVLAGLYLFNKQHKDLSEVTPDHTITATELYQEFETNEAASTEKFNGKVLEVTGKVSSVEDGNDETRNVTLLEDDQFAGVICTFQNASGTVMDIKSGDIITVRGVCSGMLMDVLLNNCVLIEIRE